MTTFRLAGAALVLALSGHAPIQQTAKEVFKKASPSVFIVVAVDQNGQPIAQGSGFAVAKRLIATNFHVVKEGAKACVIKPGTHDLIQVAGITGVDPKRDLALIQTEVDLQPLSLSDQKAEVGDTVYAIGNPQGYESTLSSGLISALRESGDPKKYQITAPISPGSSGGPVLLIDGKVVGVVVSYSEGGQNLNFAIQIEHLKRLMFASENSPPKPIGAFVGASSSPESGPDTVYVTETGHTFHRGDCRFLRLSKIPISRAKAIRLRYKPCKVCKP